MRGRVRKGGHKSHPRVNQKNSSAGSGRPHSRGTGSAAQTPGNGGSATPHGGRRVPLPERVRRGGQLRELAGLLVLQVIRVPAGGGVRQDGRRGAAGHRISVQLHMHKWQCFSQLLPIFVELGLWSVGFHYLPEVRNNSFVNTFASQNTFWLYVCSRI